MYDPAGGARGIPSVKRCGAMLLMLFLTGVALGCVLAQWLGLRCYITAEEDKSFDAALIRVLLWNAKFLLASYLLAFSPGGTLLLPLLFGAEGALLGALFGAVLSAQGAAMLPCLVAMLLFRLVLVVPYGFLLGLWCMRQSLGFGGEQDRSAFGVLVLTGAVLLAASLLECTVAKDAAYFLRFGV